MALWNETGHASKGDLIAEVRTLVGRLSPALEEMEPHERRFIEQMDEKIDRYGDDAAVTPKQLFWLRDLADKY